MSDCELYNLVLPLTKLNEMSDDMVNSKSWIGCEEWGHREV